MKIPPTVSRPATLFSKVYVDVMHMPLSHGCTYIAAARDDLSGASEFRALTANTAESMRRFLEEQVIFRYGYIQQIVTDNGPEVQGAFRAMLKRYHMPQVTISPYNSSANGVVERGHFVLRESLSKLCGESEIHKWKDYLLYAQFAEQVTISSVTCQTLFFMLHRVEAVLPFDLAEATFMIDNYQDGISTAELLVLRMHQLQKQPEDLARAADHLAKA